MKNYLVFICLLCGMAFLVGIYSVWHHSASKSNSSLASSSTSGSGGKTKESSGGITPPTRPPVMQSAEWLQYRKARLAALHANHDLEIEYQHLLQQMDEEQRKLDSAMLRVDPKLETVVTKLKSLGAHHDVPFKAPHPSILGKADYVPVVNLTPSDWQEISKAHAAAIQSDPGLATDSKALADKLGEISEKLDTVIISRNPGMAQLVAKLSNQRTVQSDLVNSASSN